MGPRLSIVLLVFGVLLTTSFAAASERVALLAPNPADLDAQEHAALVELVQRTVDARYPGASGHTGLSIDETMRLMGCSQVDAACIVELAELLGVDALLLAEVERNAAGRREMVVRFVGASGDTERFRVVIPLRPGEITRDVAPRLRSVLEGRATLDVRSDRVGDEVRVGGQVVGTTPLLLADLEPGALEVTLQRDGRMARSTAQMPAPGAWELTLSEDDFRRPWRSEQTVGLALLGGGVALGAVAITQGLGAQREQERFEETPWRREADAIATRGRRKARIATASAVGAVGLAGTGLWLTLRQAPEPDGSIARSRAVFAPWWDGSRGAGLTLSLER